MGNYRYQLKTQLHSSHAQITKLLNQAPAASEILELGIASGYMGKYLSSLNLGFSIIGIEKDRVLAQQAVPYYKRVLILDLDREDMPHLGAFDFIILADILEHLYKPLELLKKMRTLLKDNGLIVVSVPNIANFVIRLRLLFGYFNYGERGILDKEHIRFFTLKTAKQLIEASGLKIVNSYPTSIPFHLFVKPVWFSNFLNEIYYSFAKLFPNLFAYQFIFTADKLKIT